MTANDLLAALENVLEAVADARQEMDDDNDIATLADLVCDMTEEMEGLSRVATFEQNGVLSRDAGLVLTFANGAEFQITIVQSRLGDTAAAAGEDDEGDE